MPGRSSSISVTLTGEADFKAAQADIEASFAKIEKASQASVDEIKQAFAKADVGVTVDETGLTKATKDFDAFTAKLKAGSDVALTVDESDLLKAFDLAAKLGKLTEQVTITADTDELKQAQALAQSLRSFTGRINLDVQGQNDLRDALGLAQNLDQLRKVKIEVQGQEDLRRAGQIADDLERKRTIPVDAQLGDLKQLDAQIGAAGHEAGGTFAEKFGELDLGNAGSSITEQLGALGAAAGPLAAVAGAAAAVFGESLAEGINRAWNAKRDGVVREISSGLDAATLGKVGKEAGVAYAAGFGESFNQLADSAANLESSLRGIDSSLNLKEATKQSQVLADVFGVELPDQVNLLTQLISNGLVKNTDEGFNLMVQSAQKFGFRTQDIFEIFKEFAPVFKKLGVDGAKAFDIIGTEVQEGLVTQVDRAAEQFEEFNIRITDNSAKPAIDALGLSFKDMQAELASGKGDLALHQIATALLGVGDEATRNNLALQIFGASIESASDPKRVLELLATANSVGTIGQNADEAVAKLEGTTTALDKLKRGAEDLGAAGTRGLNAFFEGGQITASAQALDELKGGFGRLKDSIFGADEQAKEILPTFTQAREGVTTLTVTTEDAAVAFKHTALSVDDLQKTLDGLFNFSADKLLRDIADQGDALATSFKNGADKAVGLAGSIDITRKGGADLQSQLENLSGSLETATVKFVNGEISAAQFNQVQQAVEGQFGKTTRAAGLTTAEIEGLRGKYLELPASVTTTIIAHTDDARIAIANLQAALNNVHDKTVTVTTRNATIAALAQTTIAGRAGGGPASGLTLVGEKGPELVNLGSNAFVHTAAETSRLLDRVAPQLFSPVRPAPAAATGSKTVNFNGPIVIDKGRDLFADLLLYEQVYSAVA